MILLFLPNVLEFSVAETSEVSKPRTSATIAAMHPTTAVTPQLRVLFTRDHIAFRVSEMAEEITRDFAGQSIIFVGVLKGASIFLGDLARQVKLDATFDFISVASYGAGTKTSGEVKMNKDVDSSMAGKNVIIVEDILDTGLTMGFLRKLFLAHQPRSFKIAALLDKACRRVEPVQADYVGFVIPDEFVVGYGMDYAERYRNLPDICVLPPELQ
jgi:hypoxanthine phosphoribosyltransferase